FTNLVGGAASDTFLISGKPTANLFGGAGVDTFQFAAATSLTGTIDGGAGSDTLDWSAYKSARQVQLTAAGAIDGFAGTEASLSGGFSNIDSLIGGAGPDTLTGLNAAATWQVGATGQYTSGNSLAFNGFENLVGGRGSDRFVVPAPSSVTVAGQGGNDLLDFGPLSGPASVVLKATDVTGFGGTRTGALARIDTSVGSRPTRESPLDTVSRP